MTGLFAHRSHNQGATIWQAQQRESRAAERRQYLDLFAECLAENGSVAQCAARLGKSTAWVNQALRDIRAGLGEQAR